MCSSSADQNEISTIALSLKGFHIEKVEARVSKSYLTFTGVHPSTTIGQTSNLLALITG